MVSPLLAGFLCLAPQHRSSSVSQKRKTANICTYSSALMEMSLCQHLKAGSKSLVSLSTCRLYSLVLIPVMENINCLQSAKKNRAVVI